MVTTVNPQELSDLLTARQLDLVDVRDESDFAAGHIPGARNVPLDQLRADPDQALPHDGIVFVCAKGIRSMTAAKLADRLGFATVYSLDGGTNAWLGDGRSVDRQAAAA
jgi:rhodanese-related sulfurtransferase